MGGNSTAFWVDFRGFLQRESRHLGNWWVIITPLSRGLSNSWKSARKFEILWAVFSRIHVDCLREKAAVGVREVTEGRYWTLAEKSVLWSVRGIWIRTNSKTQIMTTVLKCNDHYTLATTSFRELGRHSADLRHAAHFHTHTRTHFHTCSTRHPGQIHCPLIFGRSKVKVLPEWEKVYR